MLSKIILYILIFSIVGKMVKNSVWKKDVSQSHEIYRMDMAGYSRVCFIWVILTTIFIGILIFFEDSSSGAGKSIVVVMFLFIDIMLYVLSKLLPHWYIEFTKQGISYSNIWGKVRSYSYNRILKITEDEKRNLLVCFDDSQKLLIESRIYTSEIFDVLNQNKIVIQKKYTKEWFEVKEDKSTYTISAIGIVISLILLIISIVGNYNLGQVFFGLLFLYMIIATLWIQSNCATIDRQSVLRKKFMRKGIKIYFSDISHIQIKTELSELRICIYAKDGRVIKIPKGWMNTDLLEEVIKDHGWPVEIIKTK